jgi:hypothetical protein
VGDYEQLTTVAEPSSPSRFRHIHPALADLALLLKHALSKAIRGVLASCDFTAIVRLRI